MRSIAILRDSDHSVNPQVVIAAALLHDLAPAEKEKENGSSSQRTESKATETARSILNNCKVDDNIIEMVGHIIANLHSQKGNPSQEMQILREADRMTHEQV